MPARTRIAAPAVACSAALTVSMASPALAAPSDAEVAAAYGAMLTKKDAAALGLRGDSSRAFSVSSSDKGSPDSPWLCDLTGSAEVKGKGAKALFSSDVLELGRGAFGEASQDVHSFASAKAAKAAYNGIVKRAKQCSGAQQPGPDDADDATGITTTLTNGTRKGSDGEKFVWVRSQTTAPGPDGFVAHEYLTVRLIGPYLQILELESEGTNAPDFTPKAMKALDALTVTLGDRWRTS